MAPLSTLRYPKKSHRKAVIFPKDSVALAEFFGIMIGDGGINNSWQVNVSMNAVKDKTYARYISRLIQGLFGLTTCSFMHAQRDSSGSMLAVRH